MTVLLPSHDASWAPSGSITPTLAHDPGGKSKPAWPAGSVVTARFSDCSLYRYELSEIWNRDLPLTMWLMMNPSVAGVAHSDPTLIRTGNYSRLWGFGGQLIGNVHAARATDARRLLDLHDPGGPENDAAILSMAKRARIVVLAYGQPPQPLRFRAHRVVSTLRQDGADLRYLELSQDGTPKHPLYLKGDLVPRQWPPMARTGA